VYIVMVASECAPVAKVGGLADVVPGLASELEIRGNTVEIILPRYTDLKQQHIWDLKVCLHDLWVPWYNGAIRCTVWFGHVHGRKCYFIEDHGSEQYFGRREIYGYHDDDLRFAFLSKAALEFMYRSGKRPDIIHCHDWPTGLLPVMLYEIYEQIGMSSTRACFTIHNFAHQGVTTTEVLHAVGLKDPSRFMRPDRLQNGQDSNLVNMIKGGIVYSNAVNTVSPQHAWEARYTDQGAGLGHTLYLHQRKFTGILNGLDYDVWNPEIDPLLPTRYNLESLAGKYESKTALRAALGLRDAYCPLIVYIGRLDRQKGVGLIEHGMRFAARNGAQFALLGSSPDGSIDSRFRGLRKQHSRDPDCRIVLGFSEELAHLMYGGADMILVPSLFEPCGLTQLIALKYGTVPIVRAVGGLVDTVFDWNHSPLPEERRNGYVFHEPDAMGLESAMSRAVGLWYHFPNVFAKLVVNGMRADHSWNESGQRYLNLYAQALAA